MKISEAFDVYERNYMLIRKQSIRIVETHRRVGQILARLNDDKDIRELTPNDVTEFYKYMSKGRSSNTVRNDIVRVRAVIRYLNILGYDVIHPELIIVPKREEKPPTFLTPEEVTMMINNAFSLRNKLVISLLYSSGIRLSEMIQLDRGSIVEKAFTVIGKGGKVRLCFIDDRTDELINRYMERRTDDCEALIISENFKKRMTPTNVQLLIKNSAKRAGLDKKVTPHTLRHSFATNFLRNNGNMRYLSQLLGHANLNTTAKYAHVVDVDLFNQYQKFHSC